jgi:hypothetical protein
MMVLHRIIVCPPTPLFANLVWFVKLVFLTIIVIIVVTSICASEKGVINVGMMYFRPVATLKIEERIEGEVLFFSSNPSFELVIIFICAILYNGYLYSFYFFLISFLQCHYGFISIILLLNFNFWAKLLALISFFSDQIVIEL